MDVLFFLLSIVAIVIMIVSIINPNKAILPFAKNSRKKAGLIWFCIAVGLFIISLIINMVRTPYYNSGTLENELVVVMPTVEVTPEAIAQPTATPIDIYSMTDEEYVKYVLDKSSEELFLMDDAIYEKSYYDIETDVYIIEAYTGGWIFDDDYWTLMEPYSKKIFKSIYNDYKLKYNAFSLIFIRDFTDEYGNEYKSRGAEVLITFETLDKINWDNIRKVTFVEIADEFYEYSK